MYSSAFCRVYNEFGWNVYPEVFAAQLLRLPELRSGAVKTALDLGCGTGVLCRVLAERGINTLGVDLSEGMIVIARENAPSLRFETGNMVTWSSKERFDLITCTGDALNHIFDPEDVRRVFNNVYAMLSPGGRFIFDLLGDREVPDGEPFTLDYSDSVRAVFRTVREPDGMVRLTVSVFENGSLTFEENILEKLHPSDRVRLMLREAGFDVLRFAHRLSEEEGTDAAAWFVIAGKERDHA